MGPRSSTPIFTGLLAASLASGGLYEIDPGSRISPSSIDRISSALLPPLPPFPTQDSLREDELQVENTFFGGQLNLSCAGPTERTSRRARTGEKCSSCECRDTFLCNRITPYLDPFRKRTSTVWEKFMAAITVTSRQGVRLELQEVETLDTESGFSRLRPRDLQVSPLQLPLPQWHPL